VVAPAEDGQGYADKGNEYARQVPCQIEEERKVDKAHGICLSVGIGRIVTWPRGWLLLGDYSEFLGRGKCYVETVKGWEGSSGGSGDGSGVDWSKGRWIIEGGAGRAVGRC